MKYKQLSIYTILIIAGITAFMGYQVVTKINFDFSMRNFYPIDHPETEFFYQYTDRFEWDDDYVLIGLETKEETVFEPKFMKAIDSLTKILNQLPVITTVASPTNMEVYRYMPFMDMVNNAPLIHLEQPEKLRKEDSSMVFARKELIGRLFAEDKKSVAIMLRQKPGLEYENCDSLVKQLEQITQPFEEFKKVHFAGKCFGQTTFVDLSRTEVVTFVGLSILLIIICLFFTYRSFWGIWMPLSVVGATVIWTIGTMMTLGFYLDFISNIIPTVILIIGISNVIHLFTKFLTELHIEGQNKLDALKIAIKKVGTATILTSLTTIIGFLSLLFSKVAPLINLGGFAALGLFYAFLLTYTLFPALLMATNYKFVFKVGQGKEFWNRNLEKLFHWVMANKKVILIGSLLLAILGAWGTMLLRVNQHVLEDISERHPQIVASRYFENDFSGTRQFEMEVVLKDKEATVLDFEVLKDLSTIEQYLQSEYGVGAMFSPLGLVKEANRMQHSGKADYYKMPKNERELKKAMKLLERYLEGSKYPEVYTEDRKIGRFAGKMPDMGSLAVGERNEALAEFMEKEGLNEKYEWHLTGSAHLMDINNNFIAQNVFYGLLFCFLIIGLIIGGLFRSIPMALIALVPNILPLLVVGGLMGLTGINIKISTSILFIISFGIAVDDSIHFLAAYRFELQKGKDRLQALLGTFQSTGKAIVVTTLILSTGFFTLVFSSFKGTFHIGVFTAVCLFIALLADLVLLPVLVYYWGGKGKAKKE
jgi:predicted RND superfamily exporter protein